LGEPVHRQHKHRFSAGFKCKKPGERFLFLKGMRSRYRLYRRGNGVFYAQDFLTGKQQSLRTRTKSEAEALLYAKNSAVQQPLLNLEIAKAHLAITDPKLATRTWADVMREYATHGRLQFTEHSLFSG
jgi:hypothetical protein